MTKAERERQERRHQREEIISRAKLVLIVLCVIAIPVTFWVNHSDVGSVKKQVARVESPCLRYGPKSPQCKAAFEAAVGTITHPEACAIERKAGTLKAIRELAIAIEARFSEPCAGARLAQEVQRGEEREASARAAGAQSPAGPPRPMSPTHPGTHHGTGPKSGGAGGTGREGSGEAPTPGSTGANPGQGEGGSEESTSTEKQGVLPSTVEAVGGAAGEVVGEVGGAVKGVGEGLGEVGCKTLGSC